MEAWMYDAIEDLMVKKATDPKKPHTFTYIIHELLRPVLESEGYTSGIGHKYIKSDSVQKTSKHA